MANIEIVLDAERKRSLVSERKITISDTLALPKIQFLLNTLLFLMHTLKQMQKDFFLNSTNANIC